MSLQAAILKVLLALPASYDDPEPLPVRWERLHQVAGEIARQSRTQGSSSKSRQMETAAMLVATGYHESRFSSLVGAGRCALGRLPEGSCDGGLARSYFQLWQVSCRRLWQRHSDLLLEATQCAARLLRRGRQKCGSVEGSFARYAVGHGCEWRGAVSRARTYRAVVHSLRTGAALKGVTA